MDTLKNKVLLTAINGLENENYEAALEKIMMIVTSPNKQTAYKKALEVRADVRELVTIEDINIKNYKAKYGYYKKIPVIQLALDYVQMPDKFFFEKYKFRYIPKDKVIEEINELIQSIQIKKALFTTYGSYMNPALNMFKSIYA